MSSSNVSAHALCTSVAAAVLLLALGVPHVVSTSAGEPAGTGPAVFRTSDACFSCHNSLASATGEDVSIGTAWRAGMMANASRDPYWQAGVRRELLDHPEAAAAIEDECSICHMPMATNQLRSTGAHGQVFAQLAALPGVTPLARLAQDGASCTVCHQISPASFGEPDSFNGRFVVERGTGVQIMRAFGPYEVDGGRARIMQSATTFAPARATHVQRSELCATCHTLFTHALGTGAGKDTLPEQVPYLEWQHSAFREEKSCQDCHMPVLATPTPISAVLGQPREHFSQHVFLGGNFVVPRLLNVHRRELGTEALPAELENGIQRTLAHLQSGAARLVLDGLDARDGTLVADVQVENLAGHKLPTAYPSRRAWLHFVVRDGAGATVFESGRPDPSGGIEGNDNDVDGARFEPHHREIRSPGDVQIYETIMGDPRGAVTTGLLTAVSYLKDNRLLPRGFEKATASPDVSVRGQAADDPDFTASGDRVRFAVPLGSSRGPYTVAVELLYQPIGARWARNLAAYRSAETERFVRYYDGLRGATLTTLARAEGRLE